MDQKVKTSRSVGPEDLSAGDYITVTLATCELIPLDGDGGWRQELEPVRIDLMPHDAGRPLKVLEACLSFVLVKTPAGAVGALDLRRHRIMRLTNAYGRRAFRELRRVRPKKRK